MNEQQKHADSIDYLLLLGFTGTFLLCLCSVGFLFFRAYLSGASGEIAQGIGFFWTIIALFLIGLPSAIISIRAIQGRETPLLNPPKLKLRYIILLFPLILLLGYFTLEKPDRITVLNPIVHIVAAAIPALFAILLVLRHSPRVSQRRFWGSLFIGTWFIPISAIIAELVLMILAMTTLFFRSMSTAEGQALLESLSNPENWASESMIESYAALLDQPIVIISIVVFVCVLVPLIEESLKSTVILPILGRKPSPSESFLSGVLGGVGFAFVEAILLTPTGMDWTQTMFTRGAATMMHTFTAGMTCWGIGQAITYKRWKRFLGAFAIAVTMHGLWNAAAIGIGIGTLAGQGGETIISSGIAQSILIMGVLVLVALSTVAFAGLVLIPDRLREDWDDLTPHTQENSDLTPSASPEIQT
jgi:hypothetical protein